MINLLKITYELYGPDDDYYQAVHSFNKLETAEKFAQFMSKADRKKYLIEMVTERIVRERTVIKEISPDPKRGISPE